MSPDDRATVQEAHDLAHGLAIMLARQDAQEKGALERNVLRVFRHVCASIADNLSAVLN